MYWVQGRERAGLKIGNRLLPWIAVGASLTTALALGAVMGFNSPARTFNASASGDTYLSSFAPATRPGVPSARY